MKITYLDKPSYLPSWAIEQLSKLGEFVIFQDLPEEEEAVLRLSNTDIAIVEWTEITKEMFEKINGLKGIVLVTTGYDFIDIESAKSKGIVVCNTPEYSRQSVAEHVIALFLTLAKDICKADLLVRKGKNSYTDHTVGLELYNKTLGVIGLGSIGSWVAKIGNGFGMKVLGCSRTPKNIDKVEDVPLEKLLQSSDFIAICVSVNNTSKQLLNKSMLQLIKPNAIIVNIATNSVLDEPTIIQMLKNGKLRGAGFEEFEDNGIAKLKNVVLTPGTAWYTQSSLDRNVEMFVDSVVAIANGKPKFVVNP